MCNSDQLQIPLENVWKSYEEIDLHGDLEPVLSGRRLRSAQRSEVLDRSENLLSYVNVHNAESIMKVIGFRRWLLTWLLTRP